MIARDEAAGRATVIYNDKSPRAGTVAASGTEAFVYKGDYDSGYAVYVNYLPSTGLLFPGTMMSDEFIMGNGFDPAVNQLSAYEFKIFRDTLDPLDGVTLATYHFELWDGDPFGAIDTPGNVIPGTQCTWTDIPGPLLTTLHCDLPAPVFLPADSLVWGVLSAEDTCRTGWRISSHVPEIGDIFRESNDLFEFQTDYDGQFYGLGHCCQDLDEPCHLILDPCAGDTMGRGFCTDLDAESAGLAWFGGPCTGGLYDFCANFVFSAFAPTDFTVTLQPRTASGAHTIQGNEITMAAGGQYIWLDILYDNWNWDPNGSLEIRTWQARIDSSGYTSGLRGTLSPWNALCTSDTDCQVAHGHNLNGVCNEPIYPPGGCSPGYQDWALDPTCPTAAGNGCLRLDLPAVGLGTPAFVYGSTRIFGYLATDDGLSHYGGTVVLEVTSAAAGTFTVPFDAANTWAKNADGVSIPMIGHVPARVTVTIGQCCLPGGACVDQVTEGECTDLGGVFAPGGTCADPCQQACCLPDGGCINALLPSECRGLGGAPMIGTCAGDGNGDGVDDACLIDPHVTVPAPSTFASFGAGTVPPIPTDFFGPGSDPFEGSVALAGVPLDRSQWGESSTLLLRSREPISQSDPEGSIGTADVEILALSLVSMDPITVTYDGGLNPESWDVAVSLSDVRQGTGPLLATKTHCNGGTFDVTLPVSPRFTFTNVSTAEQRVLDAGLEGIPVLSMQASGVPWVHSVYPDVNILKPYDGSFAPGVAQVGGCSEPESLATRGSFDVAQPVTTWSGLRPPASLSGGPRSAAATQPLDGYDCPPGSLYARPPSQGAWTAGVSEASLSWLRYDSFTGVSAPICDVHWWGTDLAWDGEYVECTENPMPFTIKFYEDAGGVPGTEVCSYAAMVTGEFVAVTSGSDLWEYHVDLDTCCDLPDGWVSIQGAGDPDCRFLWMSTDVGDGASCFFDGAELICGPPDLAYDLSICLTGGHQTVVPTVFNDPGSSTQHTVTATPGCRAPDSPVLEPTVPDNGFGTRVRYLSFELSGATEPTAVRVQFDVGLNTYTAWVGPTSAVSEQSGESGTTPAPTYQAATLQCTPFFTDWSALGSVHVYGESITPGVAYRLQAAVQGCELSEAGYSEVLLVQTSDWGDAVRDCRTTPCGPPDGDADFDDISSIVDKFRNLPGASMKSRMDVAPAVPDQIVDFTDIPSMVDAFRGLPYPWGPPPNPCP